MFRRSARAPKLPRTRWGWLVLSWILSLPILFLPVLYLAWWGAGNFLMRVNAVLAHAEPLISEIASQQAQRPIRIDKLEEDLSVKTLWSMFVHRDGLGVIAVRVDGIVVSTKRLPYIDAKGKAQVFDEPGLTGSDALARVPDATAYVSVPALLAGNVNGAVPRIEVDSPQLFGARDASGQVNVEHFLPSNPSATPSPPFLTVIQVRNARVRFRDYASLSTPSVAAQHELVIPSGVGDLSSPTTIRFAATVHAAPGTPSADRLRGAVNVQGAVGRAPIKTVVDGPTAPPQFLIHASANGINVPYWLDYFVKIPTTNPKDPNAKVPFHLESGLANVVVTAAAPRPGVRGGPLPDVGVSASVRFAGGRVTTPLLPATVDDLHGDASYVDGTATFAVGARVLEANVSASGTLWRLSPPTAEGPVPIPEMAVNVHATGLEPNRILRAVRGLIPPKSLPPPQLHLGGSVGVDALLSGLATDPVATGHFGGLQVGYEGAPTLSGIGATVAYAGGVVGVSNAVATLEGGGAISGRGVVRVMGAVPGMKTSGVGGVGDGEFAVRADDVALDALKPVRDLNAGKATTHLHLSGKAGVEAIGTLISGSLSAAANVTTAGLTVGKIAVPVARARLLVTQPRGGELGVVIPEARIESPVGALTATGSGAPPGKLSDKLAGKQAGKLAVRWAATSLDIGAITTALGLDKIGGVQSLAGLVSASGSVSGTPSDPRVTVANLTAINLRATTISNNGETRDFAIDSVRGSNIAATRRGVAFVQPLIIRRFPAMLSVAGSVTDLLPASAGATADPHLHLTVALHDLEISEIERQTQVSVASAVEKKVLGESRAATAPPPPPIGGAIALANIAVSGPVSNPVVTGSAKLGNLLVGSYPIEAGKLDFSYRDRIAQLTGVEIDASVGTLTANATIGKTGEVTGAFASKRLDLEKLTYLIRSGAGKGPASNVPEVHTAAELQQAARQFGQPPVAGAIALHGTVTGNVHRIVVDADIPESALKVSGLALSSVGVEGLQFTDNIDAGISRLEMRSLTLKQNTTIAAPVGETTVTKTPDAAIVVPARRVASSTIALTDVRAEFPTRVGDSGAVSGNLTAETGDIGALLIALQRADLLPFDAADKVGGPILGSASIDRLHVQGRLVHERNAAGEESVRFIDTTGDAALSAANLTVGGFSAPVVAGKLHVADERLVLDSLTATSPGATYRAHGSVGLDKTINAVVESNAAAIDSLRTIPGLSGLPIVHGAVDLSILARGTFDAPEVTASVEGENLDLVVAPAPPHGATTPIAATPATATAATTVKTVKTATSTAATTAVAENSDGTFRLDILRATAEYTRDAKGGSLLTLSDGLVTHGSASIQVGGTIPLGTDGLSTQLPIALTVSAPAMNLKDLAPLLGGTSAEPEVPKQPKKNLFTRLFGGLFGKKKSAPVTGSPADLGGTLAFNATLTGTLENPRLTGAIDVVDAHFTPQKPSDDTKDHINPVRDINAHLVLNNDRIDFQKLTLSLGGLNGKSGSFGTVDVGGYAGIGLLESNALVSLLRPRINVAATAQSLLLQAPIAMTVSFKDFQPTDDNLFGLKEYATAKVNGTLTIGGDNGGPGTIGNPTIATLNRTPMVISKGEIRVAGGVDSKSAASNSAIITPRFQVPIAVDDKAVISGSIFRFEVNGNALISGKLPGAGASADILGNNGFVVDATVNVVGGNLILPGLARFVVKSPQSSEFEAASSGSARPSSVTVRYGGITPGLIAHKIVAVTRQYVSNNSIAKTGGNERDAVSGNNVFTSSSQAPSAYSGPQTSYVITATIDGPINIFDTASGGGDILVSSSGKQLVMFTSDPEIPGGQAGILALLGAQQELAQTIGGDPTAAATALVNRAFYNSFVPQAFAPVTSGIQSALNLEDFSLSYDPSGYSQLFIAKRFPNPFDKLVAQYTRQVSTRSTAGTGLQEQPYLFSLSYDLFQFRANAKGLQPNVQLGLSTDEQHINTYFLRSSASF